MRVGQRPFATLLGRPLVLENARARRARPGLRPQHVAAIRACAELCGGASEGVEVGSRAFRFSPGTKIRGGRFSWDIGTAGSASMLALGILPVACFAESPVEATITGGVFQDFAPSPHHTQHVLAPLLARMGARVELIACGPTPMLEAATRVAQAYGLPCQVSLEEYMACAVGGCAGCAVPVHTAEGLAMKRVCVDGPVFDADEIFPPPA